MEDVHIYRNLTKGCWSVRKRGKIVMHARSISLNDVSFHVQEAGRMRVLRERKKYVHAYCKGNISDANYGCTKEVTYNPYKKGHFYDKKTGKRIDAAKCTYFSEDGRVYYA